MLLTLVAMSVLQAGAYEPDKPLLPPYLPRSAAIGMFINPPMVSPHVRLFWEGELIDQPRNKLIWIAGLGSAFGIGAQPPMTAHFQHVVLAGFGFRSDHQLLHWGFHVAAGPVWYRAAYKPNAAYAFENRVLGYIEGRGQLGLRVLPHLRIAVYAGYASPFTFQPQFPGNTFVGGFDFGIALDWR
ncbi:MAG: hypothetical protein QM817_11270 [Archangium sp.]